jgi:hypothetical protein
MKLEIIRNPDSELPKNEVAKTLEKAKEKSEESLLNRNFKTPLADIARSDSAVAFGENYNGAVYPATPQAFITSQLSPQGLAGLKLNKVTTLSLKYSVNWFSDPFYTGGALNAPSSSFTVPTFLTLGVWNNNYFYDTNVLGSTVNDKFEVLNCIQIGDLLFNKDAGDSGVFKYETAKGEINLLNTISGRALVSTLSGIEQRDFTVDPEKITPEQLERILNGDINQIAVIISTDASGISTANSDFLLEFLQFNGVVAGWNVGLYYIGLIASY